jgi:ribose/xylose/arabinose/galactoside ABC-type transport system permease subunit
MIENAVPVRRFGVSRSSLQKLIIVGIMLILVIALSLLSREFLTFSNFSNVTRQIAIVIITGSAVTLLMISGNIDLSVGSVVAMTGVLVAIFSSRLGIPLWISVILASLFGGVTGSINGFLVTKLKIPSVIATLGTMYVARGLAYVFCDGKTVNLGLPDNFRWLGGGFVGPVPIPLLLTVVIACVFIFVQMKTLLGKYAFAIGGNKVTALLSGINVNLVTFLLFILSGILAGFSGTILASRMGVGMPTVGIGFEFDVIVAILLGGTSLSGGVGTVWGMIVGAFIVGLLGNGLNLLNVFTFYQSILKGIVLVVAVVLDITLKEKLE